MIALSPGMMQKTRQILTISLAVLAICFSANTYAEEANLKPKSEGLGWVLALDPIPGDALFYAEKPIQGTINLVLGFFGGIIFYFGLASALTEGDRGCEDFCIRGEDIMILGSVLYVPFLIWDAIGGVHGVRKHNTEIERKKHSILTTFQPTLAIADGGAFVGGQFKF